MSVLSSLRRAQKGATSAEFALVLPVAILFLLGIIDAGRYAWALNRIEKSVQAGARYAVATDIVPNEVNAKDFVGFSCPGGTLGAGDPICAEAMGTIQCTKSGTGVSCTCTESSLGASSCEFDTADPNTAAFDNIVNRMRVIDPLIPPEMVSVTYSGSGLGYAGDPKTDDDGNDLSDVAPIVTVAVENVAFRLYFLLGTTVNLPRFSYSLTLEDGDGAKAY